MRRRSMPSILLIEDDKTIRLALGFTLTNEGYALTVATDGAQGLEFARTTDPDLILLDVMLPKLSGLEVARQLRSDGSKVPIIMLTALDQETDKVAGLDAGADDYVTKPFSVREVMARVKAVLSRRKPAPAPTAGKDDAKSQGLTINTANKTVCIDGNSIGLTRTEYELMKLLLEHRGQVFSRQQLLDSVWPQDVIVTERTVDVNIARLRKKLDRYAACLVSRTGFGYCFEEEIEK